MPLFFRAALLLAAVASSKAETPKPQILTIASGVPLHIRITRTAKLLTGQPVEGVLTEPIYVVDRLVLPKGAIAHGVVIAYAPVPGKVRAQAWLNGDVTPLHQPVVAFTSLHIPGIATDFDFSSHALVRDTQLVRFVAANKRPSLKQRVRKIVHDRIQSARTELFSPGKKDRALRLFYSQLPYHPQRIWAGTQFIADLDAPASIALPAQSPVLLSASTSLDGITVMARLTDTLNSRNARKNDPVRAIVTEPVLDANHKLVLAEGAELRGTVTESRAARSFGRNGQLRFAFRGVEVPGQHIQQAYGTVKAAEGIAGENITLDEEGNVKANPGQNRFVAPLLLAATALGGHDDDDDSRRGFGAGGNTGKMTVASNGFGLIARVLAFTVHSQAMATGFGAYGFGKSIYFRFLTRGNQVTFPKDTEVAVQLSVR
jgi:hypothetical protein